MAGASQARRDSIIRENQKQRRDSADRLGVQDALLYSVYSLSGSRPEEEEEGWVELVPNKGRHDQL